MTLTPAEIIKIGLLARIKITPTDIEKYADIKKIIELAEKFKNVDTSDVHPMAHPHNITQRLRQDIVTETNQRNKLQQTAQQTELGLYLVPTVIE